MPRAGCHVVRMPRSLTAGKSTCPAAPLEPLLLRGDLEKRMVRTVAKRSGDPGASPGRNEKKLTIRIPSDLHKVWLGGATEQGTTLKAYIVTLVAAGRRQMNEERDPFIIQNLTEAVNRQAEEQATLRKLLESYKELLAAKHYDAIELARAKDTIMGIMTASENIDAVKRIVSYDHLVSYVAKKMPLLERYLIPTPEQPETILDEILLELETRHLLSRDDEGKITWSINLWER